MSDCPARTIYVSGQPRTGMARHLGRRELLATAAGLATAWGTSGVVSGADGAAADGFDPQRHAFGFRNWTPATQYFDAPPDPTVAEVVEEIQATWRGPAEDLLDLDTARLSRRTLEALAIPLQVAVTQRAGMNGHCYGMSLTAQQYFERPATIPVDRPVASEIEHPTAPLDAPETPVYDAIHHTQADQFLRFRSWVARRAMLAPDWIDLAAVLRDVEAVVSSHGTASLLVFDRHLFGHQVLAYGYHDDGDVVRIPIYDPNLRAAAYGTTQPTLRFIQSDGALTMEPYDRYTHLLFNRYDRIEQATGRDRATPLEHLSVGRPTVREALLPVVVILSDTTDATLTVTGPDGRALDRLRGRFMHRDRGAHARIRTRYGADRGTYRIGVYGTSATAYDLTAVAADTDGVIVDESRSGHVAAGELHTYALTVPDGDEGRVARDGDDRIRPAVIGGAAVGGVAAGAVGLQVLQRLRDRDG